MDKEIIFQQFEEIEEKAERIIAVCQSYKIENEELSKKIKLLEEDLQASIEAEKAYNEEKKLIRSKIDNLLIKLEDMAAEKK